MKEDITLEIELTNGVTAEVTDTLSVKGLKGSVERLFRHPRITVSVSPEKIILFSAAATKREQKVIYSFESHIKNMVKGVQEPHIYKVKICSGHFPMSVTISGEELTIKNFLGEAVPRKVLLLPGSEVKIDGSEITVSSPNKEIAGQNAAKIESLTRITNKDRRIFQDGCYITQKAGKDIA
ncbi:MAG: 50S ribosomal protein L6 [archaeon]|nr:50S ribosomal protein L6 [archaeon]